MSYFDSPKNQAMWNRELSDLKKQKELRKQGLDPSVNKPQVEAERDKGMKAFSSKREKTSYQELLKEEAELTKQSRAARKERVTQKVHQKENPDLQKKGMSV